MTNLRLHNGWVRLKNGFDVEFAHGIPVVLSDNGLVGPVDDAELDEEVSNLSGLRSIILGWHDGENRNEQETELCIDAMQFEEVLKRLAMSSAALFVERYHQSIQSNSVDWDKAEYDYDFSTAVEHCCLDPVDYNKNDFFDMYVDCMHKESKRLIDEAKNPQVKAE